MSGNNLMCPCWLKWWRKLLEITVLLINRFCKD